MAEWVTVVSEDKLTFEGLFSMSELFRIIDKYFRLKGWDKKIQFDEEYDTPTGKYIHVKTDPYKKIDDYIRMEMRIWLYVNDMIEVEREIEGTKVILNKGNVTLIFDAFMQTDYRSNWDSKPLYFLIRTLMEKYFLKGRIQFYEENLRHTLTELREEIAGYLNLQKYLYP